MHKLTFNIIVFRAVSIMGSHADLEINALFYNFTTVLVLMLVLMGIYFRSSRDIYVVLLPMKRKSTSGVLFHTASSV